jgi:hypothetical protein
MGFLAPKVPAMPTIPSAPPPPPALGEIQGQKPGVKSQAPTALPAGATAGGLNLGTLSLTPTFLGGPGMSAGAGGGSQKTFLGQ